MLLNDAEILQYHLDHQPLTIPSEPENIQPASIDLRLGEFDKYAEGVSYTDTHYFLQPGTFALFETLEWVSLPGDLAAQVWGKSSWGRQGLLIHAAGWVDPGFSGTLTLQAKNLSSDVISIPKRAKICQLAFLRLHRADKEYGLRGNHYQGQKGVTGARV